MEGSLSSIKEIKWIYTAIKLRDLLCLKFGIHNSGTSHEKFHRMIWRLIGLFTRGYQLLKGSEVVRPKFARSTGMSHSEDRRRNCEEVMRIEREEAGYCIFGTDLCNQRFLIL